MTLKSPLRGSSASPSGGDTPSRAPGERNKVPLCSAPLETGDGNPLSLPNSAAQQLHTTRVDTWRAPASRPTHAGSVIDGRRGDKRTVYGCAHRRSPGHMTQRRPHRDRTRRDRPAAPSRQGRPAAQRTARTPDQWERATHMGSRSRQWWTARRRRTCTSGF